MFQPSYAKQIDLDNAYDKFIKFRQNHKNDIEYVDFGKGFTFYYYKPSKKVVMHNDWIIFNRLHEVLDICSDIDYNRYYKSKIKQS